MLFHQAVLCRDLCRRWWWLLLVLCADLTLFSWYCGARPTYPGIQVSLTATGSTHFALVHPLGTQPDGITSPASPAFGDQPEDNERFRTWSYSVGRYRILGIRDLHADEEVAAHLEIYDGDHIIFEADGYDFNLVDDGWLGQDITGNGVPCVMVEEFSGGAHCCSTYLLLEFGPSFREAATIEARDSGIELADLNGDGLPEVMLGDYSLDYAFACHAASPIPRLVLRYHEGEGYEVAADLMRTEPPNEQALREVAETVWNECQEEQEDGLVRLLSPVGWGNGTTLWGTMLDLIYGGHEDLALEFFNMAWPPWADGKEEALAHFRQEVASSPWYQQVAAQTGMGEIMEEENDRD